MIGSKLTVPLILISNRNPAGSQMPNGKCNVMFYLVECPIVLINYLCFWEECRQKFEMNKTFQVYSSLFFELIDSCTNS